MKFIKTTIVLMIIELAFLSGIISIFTTNVIVIISIVLGWAVVETLAGIAIITWLRKKIYGDTFADNKSFVKYLNDLYA